MTQEPSAPEDADRWWGMWQKRLDEGEDPTEFIQSFPDDALVVLLKVASDDRATERNLILAETLRRMSGRPSKRSALATDLLDDALHDGGMNVDRTAQAVHETEAAVESKKSGKIEGKKDPRTVAHDASHEVEALRDIAHEAERKADYLMRLHRTGEFVTPGRRGEESDGKEDSDG